MKKQQIIFIRGGETFANYEDYIKTLKSWEFDPYKERQKRWQVELPEILGDSFDFITPTMPSKYNAKYREWKIWFDKVVPFLQQDVILIGHSLGTIFLIKYLSENNLKIKVKALLLVAPVFDGFDENGREIYSMADFVLNEGKLKNVEKQASKIIIYHSKDDFVVPFFQAEKYAKIFKDAEFNIFEDRNHFLQEQFPEIVKDIQDLR